VLTEKGKLASRLLVEFPDQNHQLERKRRQRLFWTGLAMTQIILVTVVWAQYFTGYVDLAATAQRSVVSVAYAGLAYVGYKAFSKRSEIDLTREQSKFKTGYIVGGALLGAWVAFFGTLLLIRYLDSGWFGIEILWAFHITLGGIGGYYLGKRNGFEKPRWMIWTDEKLGF
jgi:hypothetical protein